MNATALDLAPPSKMMPRDWDQHAYPEVSPKYDRGEHEEPAIDLGNGHKLHARQYGNPEGEPVIVLHGGPGGGCDGIYARYFDPTRYRIILFDQRGCLNSTPTTHQDLAGGMKGNDTAHLVEDINAVRKHFHINGKMHLEGGSWGSTLALAYAIKHPQNVKSLMLRGVFLGTQKGMKYIFQGNSADYQECDEALRTKFDTLNDKLGAAHKAATSLEQAEKSTDPDKAEKIAQAQADIAAHPMLSEEELAEWRKAKTAISEHFYRQPTPVEGSYRAWGGKGLVDQIKIPAEAHDHYQHMVDGYAFGWDRFVRQIPKAERKDMIAAYVARLEATTDESLRGTGKFDRAANRIDPDYQQACAFAFAQWEGLISQFSQEVKPDGFIDLDKFCDPKFATDFARIEARYTKDGFYLSEDGRPTPGGSDYLLKNLNRIAKYNIPIAIAHGRDDQVCPVQDAYDLEARYNEALAKAIKDPAERAKVSMEITPLTGHSMIEKGNTVGLIKLIQNAPRMTPDEINAVNETGPTLAQVVGGKYREGSLAHTTGIAKQ